MENINKVNIYVGKVGQAYVDKETAEQNYIAAAKNVSDVEEIIGIAEQYNTQAEVILTSAEEAHEHAQQIKSTIEAYITQYENDEVIHNQLVSLLNRLNENDTDGDYTNGGNVRTAQGNIEFIVNLQNELVEIIELANDLLSENQAYLNECETAKTNAIEIFKSYLPAEEENQSNKSDEAENELLTRLAEVADGLETAQTTTANINNTTNQVQTEANNIIEGESEVPTYTAEEAAAYNAQLEGAKTVNDWKIEPVEAQPAIYNFESYDSQSKNTKYGEGKVKVIEMRAGGATVEVIENNAIDPNAAEFVGQQFNVATGLATDEAIQLYTLQNEPIDIWVTVDLVSEASDAVEGVKYTQEEADAYNATLEGAVKAGDPK